MSEIRKMQRNLNFILILGVLVSVILVMSGGSIFLMHYGSELASEEFVYVADYSTNVIRIFHSALSFSPLGMIELGLVVLVATQIVRVMYLCMFYGRTRDYWFMGMSLFIFCVMVYGFFGA